MDIEQAISLALQSKTIAVVGLSRNPEKASYQVASYLKSHGYDIVPINPTANEVLGEKCYGSLLDLPVALKRQIEVVDIFRRAADVPP
ncbi:MAG TPA: CoA-binding protein, partial [Candidatus Acidoferrum sp.]|nr:CoA-binding protein [Candidatus Acidoferrum sp.]